MSMRDRQRSRSTACLVTAGALAAGGLAWAMAGAGLDGGARLQSASATTVTTVAVAPKGPALGYLRADYIGFSYESSTINSGNFAPAGNYPALLANLGTGVLRFGGNSVDTPSYTGVTTSALGGLASLVTKSGWKVLYTVNLGSFNAAQITGDAGAVATKLGPGLYAIACGNEPDNYANRAIRVSGYTEQSYLSTDLPPCVKAVHTGAPGAPFTGPNTFHVAWLPPYATAEKGVVSRLAEQSYPMTNCGKGTPGGSATLLSRTTAGREVSVLNATRSAAATAGVPFVIGETNSASCGGIPGMSNTYAAALWAADWLLIGAERGAKGMYFHGSLTAACGSGYSPLCKMSSGQLGVMPVYYGLLFAHLMGPGWTLPAKVTTTADIAAHAVRDGNGRIHVMVENLSAAPTSVTLNVPGAAGTASTLRLTGTSLTTTTGVRIQGAAVSATGSFKPGTAGTLTCRSGTCQFSLPAYTGVLALLPVIH
jgi:hypothetical protein